MFRVFITVVLTGLVSLPHGVCFCHYLSVDVPREEISCCELATTMPSAPTNPRPADDSDDDTDCSCQLREVLALSPTAVHPGSDSFDHFSGLAELSTDSTSLSAVGEFHLLPHDPSDGPIALTLRALRI